MGDKKIYIVTKVFDKPGYLAYLCKTPNVARCLSGTLEAMRVDEVQIVILDSPEIYICGRYEGLHWPSGPIKPCRITLTIIWKMTGVIAAKWLRTFLVNAAKNCITPPKPLRPNGFPFDGLITPTLKATGSSPVVSTRKETCLWIQKLLHGNWPKPDLHNREISIRCSFEECCFHHTSERVL